MIQNGFSKLYWGFFFTMIDFKISGFDILPDIVGYVLFAMGFSILEQYSTYFSKAKYFNIPLLILSIFSIYEKPQQVSGIQIGSLGIFGIVIGIVSVILSLLAIYNLFLGIKEMAEKHGASAVYQLADRRWNQYIILQMLILLALMLIFIPLLAIAYIIFLLFISIAFTVLLMQFMKECGNTLTDNSVYVGNDESYNGVNVKENYQENDVLNDSGIVDDNDDVKNGGINNDKEN